MLTVNVQDVQPILDAPVGTIIGLTKQGGCWEIIRRESRAGEFVDFTDGDGKVCRLYVRQFAMMPRGVIERRRW